MNDAQTAPPETPAPQKPVIVRHATPEDAAAVAEIYAHAVLYGLGTFEETPPPADEVAARIEGVKRFGLPWVVASDGDAPDARLLGFAYASLFRPRAAYRFTVEDSVYVASEVKGRGVGRALLGRVIGQCEALGMRQMLAVIGDSGNAASIRLHASLGFERGGLLPAVGRKHDQWVDVVIMRRALNGGSSLAAALGDGLSLGGWGEAAKAIAPPPPTTGGSSGA